MTASSVPSFDLLDRPCLDVCWLPGKAGPDRVGLRELLLRAHEIAGLAQGPPPALSALYRLLYALAARVTELDEARDGPDEWGDRRIDALEEGRFPPERVAEYFTAYADRFDLYGPERPFLQDPRLREQCAKSSGINKLMFGRPAGNNSVWFGHHRDDAPVAVSSAEALAHLLMWHYYGPSGRCTSRTVGRTTAADVYAGPLRGSLSYHPEGNTLHATLIAGLVPPAETVRRSTDLCVWERDALPDADGVPPSTVGPCARWTDGSQHALLLVPDIDGSHTADAYVTWAYRVKRPWVNDAYVIRQLSQQGNLYTRPADSSRALWRDVDALLLQEPEGSARPRRPDVFEEMVRDLGNLPVRALGFEQDGKTKDVQYVSGATPPILGLLDRVNPNDARRVGTLRVAGETFGWRLRTAANRAWAGVVDAEKAVPSAWGAQAEALYWPRAEAEFWRRVQARDFEQPWEAFRRLAEAAFNEVTDPASRTARRTRAIERARLALYGGSRAKRAAVQA
ncbi:type I-E CRISPR-associated protein Cse1/CasA [Yinghuangia aomiensis]